MKSDVIWIMSIISLSIGGTFAIIYIMRHFMDYFERRRNR
jgi:hypothetical protein